MERLSDAVRNYIESLERTLESATAELSLHYALKALLEAAIRLLQLPIQVVHEPAKTAHGRPDFVLMAHDAPIGYVEAEAYGGDLDRLTGDAKAQNERFIQNLGNFLQTNYTEFRLYQGGTLQAQVRLTTPPTQLQIRDLHDLLQSFLGAIPESPATAHDLAQLLARRTRQLRYALLTALRHDKDSSLINLHRAFSEVLLPDLSYEAFADLYAQTLAYGLFAARLTHPQQRPFVRALASGLIPQTNPFLRKLFHQISQVDLAPSIAWIADAITALLDRTDVAAVLQDFGKRTGREDPVVHFYEDFLSAYDPELREVRGVYYTPESVVGYIVRSIDNLLQREFQQPLGLAQEGTLILDPACGTGSFLFAVVAHIFQTIVRARGAGVWRAYVEQHLLHQLFGFELLAAPYAVAHLKLALQLQQTGYTFREGQRLGIYLTNTLEEAIPKSTLLLGEYISEEANAAVAIKRDKPILVVLGNPPYSGHSANRSYAVKDGKRTPTWIGERIEDYKWVDGKPLQEKNPKWLQDDYVKFVRFAEWRIAQTGKGIVGFITNHAYLDNPTFRGMRQHLLRTFDRLYVLNLHGNVRKKERALDGSPDENVFDIQQGVAILLAVKHGRGTPDAPQLYYADLWGTRQQKYDWLNQNDIVSTPWQTLQPTAPHYLFVPVDTAFQAESERGWRIPDIFPLHSVGIVTARDKLTIHFTPEGVWRTLSEFVQLPEEVARERFQLGQDARDWKVALAQKDLRDAGVPEHEASKRLIVPILYRPFDRRYTFYTGRSRGIHCMPRPEVMAHLLPDTYPFAGQSPAAPSEPTHLPQNLALIIGRAGEATGDDEWNIVFACAVPVDLNVFRRGGGEVFPLYRYPNRQFKQKELYGTPDYELNLAPDFLQALSAAVGTPVEALVPEDVLAYLYAVLHSPTYRQRYAEFLRRDLPRVPLPPDGAIYAQLAEAGKRLMALHLLESPALQAPSVRFPVPGDNFVEKVRYESDRLWINPRQYFEPVSSAVWAFRVGGYAVAEKWLSERKGHALSADELLLFPKILTAIEQTLGEMDKVDWIVKSAFMWYNTI